MEELRGIHVRIEVDTNKQTRVLSQHFDTAAEALWAAAEFLAESELD